MPTIIHGKTTWSGSRDEEGHRTYKVVYFIEATRIDGPSLILRTIGLPKPGSIWNFGNGEIDLWAWCRPDMEAQPVITKEPNRYWEVTCTFSSKPISKDQQRCNNTQIENPILEPPKISGSFVKYSREATEDLYGEPIVNSSHERFRGPQVEFDESRPTVRIERNYLKLDLALLALFRDSVNSRPIWGLPSRCVKLSNISWERKFYGTCFEYYTVVLEFDINYDTFDRELLDEGTKVLRGRWNKRGEWELIEINKKPPNPANPAHFDRFKDRDGNPTNVILDGGGRPYNPDIITTNDCSACDDGAPFRWRVTGFPSSEGGFNGILTHKVDCTWSAGLPVSDLPEDPDPTVYPVILDYAGGQWELQLDYYKTIKPGANNTWTSLLSASAQGKCFEKITLYSNDITAFPHIDTLTIEPVKPDPPGKIKVQKYHARDFLLLGVPIILGS